MADIYSPTNYTFYPWTLPQDLTPAKGYSSAIKTAQVSTLTFPNLQQGGILDGSQDATIPLGSLYKVLEGVVINSLSNLRLNMVEEPKSLLLPGDDGSVVEIETGRQLRVHGIANLALGRDEKVILSNEALRAFPNADPHFSRIKDLEMIDLVIDVPTDSAKVEPSVRDLGTNNASIPTESIWSDLEAKLAKLLTGAQPSKSDASASSQKSETPSLTREIIPAILPTGAGAAPLPSAMDTDTDPLTLQPGSLPFHRTLFLDSTLCTHQLPAALTKSHSILIVKRGGCSFNHKLSNIPAFAPAPEALQLVIVISVAEAELASEAAAAAAAGATTADGDVDRSQVPAAAVSNDLIRPLLDQPQLTPHGFERRNGISMVMVDGSADTVATLRRAASTIASFDEKGEIVEEKDTVDKAAAVVDDDEKDGKQNGNKAARPGFAIKRRFWFESLGLPIKNMIML